MRSWRSRGGPLSWPEAARPFPPSSLPSMAGLYAAIPQVERAIAVHLCPRNAATWRNRPELCPAVLGGTAADRGDPPHPTPAWRTDHRCPRGQALVCPAPWVSRKSTKRPWRGQPGDVGVCSFSGDSENNAAPSPGGGPGGESYVSFCFCSAVPSFSKKEQWLGIWHPQLQSRRSGCFIWDHFSTGYTPKSRGGHGAAVHFEWASPSSVAVPSAPGRTLPFYGPGCP